MKIPNEIDDATKDHAEEVSGGFLASLGIESPKRILVFVSCVLCALAVSIWAGFGSSLEPAARRGLFILVLAALLWVTEAIPAFAVGILVIGLNIALLGKPEGVFAETSRDWEQFVVVIGHPLVWLFFGGFVLAAGMAQTGLDRWLAIRLLGRLGKRPAPVLLGVMAITFVLSMFMSNTATTAMMLALLAPVLAAFDAQDRFARGLLLGLAAAANLGGMGSLIGTPPNAIAVGALADSSASISLTFLSWLAIGLPPALLLVGLVYFMILKLYPSSREFLPVEALTQNHDPAKHVSPLWERWVVTGTVLLTIGLWLTAGWHGIPTAAVSFVPIVALTTSGILGPREIRGLNYDVLFLLAGGLALGQMVTRTGLSTWIVERLPVEGLGTIGVALLLAYLTAILSNFMSNTAAANILVPLGITMAVGAEAAVALPIALAASSAMCLPIATPPNALTFATGRCQTKDFLLLGAVIGILAPAMAVLWSSVILKVVLGSG